MVWWRWFAVWMRRRADEGLGEGMGVEVDWGCWLWWTLTARTDCLACLRLDWDVRETDHGHSVMVELLRASARELVRVGYDDAAGTASDRPLFVFSPLLLPLPTWATSDAWGLIFAVYCSPMTQPTATRLTSVPTPCAGEVWERGDGAARRPPELAPGRAHPSPCSPLARLTKCLARAGRQQGKQHKAATPPPAHARQV